MPKPQIRIKKSFGNVFIQELSPAGKWQKMERSLNLPAAGENRIIDLYHRLLLEGYQEEVLTPTTI